MNKKLWMALCASSVVTISGCATFAEMAGANTATLNAVATEGFNKTFLEKVDVNKESFECLKKKYIQVLSDYIEILKNGFVERKE